MVYFAAREIYSSPNEESRYPNHHKRIIRHEKLIYLYATKMLVYIKYIKAEINWTMQSKDNITIRRTDKSL